MFLAVPEPLVIQILHRSRPHPPGENRLIKPRPQHAIERHGAELGLVDADRRVICLVIEPAGGEVMTRRVAGGDVVGD